MEEGKIIESHHDTQMYREKFLLLFLPVFLAVALTCAAPAHSFEVHRPFVGENRVPLSIPEMEVPFADRFLSVWKFELFVIDGHPVSVNHFAMALLAFFIGLAVLGQLSGFSKSGYCRRPP